MDAKFIRCRTPGDILVFKTEADFDAFLYKSIAQDIAGAPDPNLCKHHHRIIIGDAEFKTLKKKEKRK